MDKSIRQNEPVSLDEPVIQDDLVRRVEPVRQDKPVIVVACA